MVHLNVKIHETAKGEYPEEYVEVFAYGHSKKPTYHSDTGDMRPETDDDDDWYICDYSEQYGFSKTKGITRFMDIKYWFHPPVVKNLEIYGNNE